MKPARSLLVVLIVMTATLMLNGLAPAGAFASAPTVVHLVGDEFPIEVNGPTDSPNNGIKFELQAPAFGFSGEGMSFQMKFGSASSGKYALTYLNMKTSFIGGGVCTSPGASSGEVLIPEDTATLVHDVNATEGVAVLFNVTEFTLDCGVTIFKLRGNFLGLVTPLGSEKTSGFELSVQCSTTQSQPQETKYWDSEGTERTALLSINFGTGFKRICPDWGSTTIPLTASRMIQLIS